MSSFDRDSRGKYKKEFTDFIYSKKLKVFYEECCICGWNEAVIDLAHLIAHKDKGEYYINNIVPLCPNHHRLLDRDLLNEIHWDAIHGFIRRIYELAV